METEKNRQLKEKEKQTKKLADKNNRQMRGLKKNTSRSNGRDAKEQTGANSLARNRRKGERNDKQL